MSKNLLVTGGTGFVGGNLIPKLNKYHVSALSSKELLSDKNVKCFDFRVSPDSDFSEALDDVDVIIHLAARVHLMSDSANNPLQEYRNVNTFGTLNLARQAALSGVKRFVFVSSIKVNGEDTTSKKAFKSDDEPSPEDDYGVSKAEAEVGLFKLAKETGMEVVVIRPALVYGPGVKANFASLMNLVAKGIPLPFGRIKDNRRSLVSVTNLIDLIITCIDHPKAAGEIFLVSDDRDVSTFDMVAIMAKALGKPSRQLPVPRKCFELAGTIFGKQDIVNRLLGSMAVDITHTKQTLDWVPPQTLEQGFNEAAQVVLDYKKSTH
ncbi:UDP-glucose 4-epimerase family protein [Shewanella intestini]|uniref:SDR family oxidoreductase n=1 Tax=Shewanella intestini TaxID=2017544 RepID=A0ABS5I2D6_9GAMM|nr:MULTISPECIES: SDR family oxidoreductase [Shewanella]MBR9728203.1 SDR family oxidoreductase [Shewanella intestini]MRG35668.1 NAD-dependent epimerase/dehydratase family protein [Shewanella sp. XMDDZSB0408]